MTLSISDTSLCGRFIRVWKSPVADGGRQRLVKLSATLIPAEKLDPSLLIHVKPPGPIAMRKFATEH